MAPLCLITAALLACLPLTVATLLDTLPFGEEPPEKAHALIGDRTEVLRGGLDLPALKAPAGIAQAQEMISGKVVPLAAPLKVGPRSTAVLYLGP